MDEYRQELTVNSKWLFMFSLSGRRRGSKGRRGGTSPLGCSRHRDAKQRIKLQAFAIEYIKSMQVRRRLPLFRDDKSAGFVVCASWLLNAPLRWGAAGVPRGGAEVRRPLGAVATATPSSESNAKRLQLNLLQ
jgi:hypothetical protein